MKHLIIIATFLVAAVTSSNTKLDRMAPFCEEIPKAVQLFANFNPET